ncbi:hypothetical protein CcCBS67573_g08514, partial [Chytriomyces confervae]
MSQQQPLSMPTSSSSFTSTPEQQQQQQHRMLGPGGIDILSDQDDDYFIDDQMIQDANQHFHHPNAKHEIQRSPHTQDLHSFRQSGGLAMPYRDTKTGNIYTIPSSLPTSSGFHYPQVPYQPRSLSLSPQSNFYIGPSLSAGGRENQSPTCSNANVGTTTQQSPYQAIQHAHGAFSESAPPGPVQVVHAHRCPQCLIPFTRKNDLLRHIKTVHQLASTQMNDTLNLLESPEQPFRAKRCNEHRLIPDDTVECLMAPDSRRRGGKFNGLWGGIPATCKSISSTTIRPRYPSFGAQRHLLKTEVFYRKLQYQQQRKTHKHHDQPHQQPAYRIAGIDLLNSSNDFDSGFHHSLTPLPSISHGFAPVPPVEMQTVLPFLGVVPSQQQRVVAQGIIRATSIVSSSDDGTDSKTSQQQQQREVSPTLHLKQTRNRSGQTVYACPFPGCIKEFSESYNVKAHYFLHQNMRPYHCRSCTADFAR